MAKLVNRITQLGVVRVHSWIYSFHTLVHPQVPNRCSSAMGSLEDHPCDIQTGRAKVGNRITQIGTQSYSMMVHAHTPNQNGVAKPTQPHSQIGENVSRKDKISFLMGTLADIKDSKEAVYGALDAWVAWEQNFPIGRLKNVLIALEKEQQWHRVVQVIKWMLSKGQGNTMGTYGQLIRALDMDHRAEEAHAIWVKKIGGDLHSVPWQLCKIMIYVYYRNNMLENLVKLFKGLEAFDRKPPEKSIVQKVANAYELLGLVEERDRVLNKYENLFSDTGRLKKTKNFPRRRINSGV